MRCCKLYLILIVLIIITSGCSKQTEDEQVNSLYPMKLEDSEKNLVALINGSDESYLLSGTFNDEVNSVHFIVESYAEGELVEKVIGQDFLVDDELDIAIKPKGNGTWDISLGLESGIVSTSMSLKEAFNIEDDILQVGGFLNYKVVLQTDEPQIIGIYYFNDSYNIGHEASFYEKNTIEQLKHFRYLYVMKVALN